MSTPAQSQRAPCPKCGESMRQEKDGVRLPPMPHVFWLCTNSRCEDGKKNRVYSGG